MVDTTEVFQLGTRPHYLSFAMGEVKNSWRRDDSAAFRIRMAGASDDALILDQPPLSNLTNLWQAF